MPKLNDTQAVLLAAAANRDDSSLYPLPDSLSAKARIPAALTALIKYGYVAERETSDVALVHRTEDGTRIGLFATDAGLSVIGIEANSAAANAPPLPPPSAATTGSVSAKGTAVLELLRRPGGATLDDLVAATGWLPHSTRAALTGLRKKGHAITREKRDGVSTYALGSAA